jgi:hypothetical protein
MRRTLQLIIGLLVLFIPEILRVYYIMPFPGSQHDDTISVAYFLHEYLFWIRIIGIILIAGPILYYFRNSGFWKKAGLSILLLLYALIFYAFNFRFVADRIFYQPQHKLLLPASANKVDTNQLVIGIFINGEAKAYPIEIIGYHHQVQDAAGGTPVMVTYCTVCRTGRVFSPFIHGHNEKFRLVGMDHFNAMFEDQSTKSWWRQVNGEAIAGPLKGESLKELPSTQMRLGAWIREYPNTLILQPDVKFKVRYKDLQGFDSGTIKGSLEHRDSSSWALKSWVIGINLNGHAKAYDWNDLVTSKIINDSVANKQVLLVLEDDGASFHVWNRLVNDRVLTFEMDTSSKLFRDVQTHSTWSWSGTSIEGPLKDSKLIPIQSSQEFWHSWKTFHPTTSRYKI